MRTSSIRLRLRWVALAAIVIAIATALAVIDHNDRLRGRITISRAQLTYESTRLARERAEHAVKDYTEQTFPRQLALAASKIEQAQQALKLTTTMSDPAADWARYIDSKGYLLLVERSDRKPLAIRRATFALDQARINKLVLVEYTKIRTLEKLDEQVTKAKAVESASRARYVAAIETPVGLLAKLSRRMRTR
jgi:hypothetical protein